jgi:hypothetical protein
MDWGADPNLAGKGAMSPLEIVKQQGWIELLPLLTPQK